MVLLFDISYTVGCWEDVDEAGSPVSTNLKVFDIVFLIEPHHHVHYDSTVLYLLYPGMIKRLKLIDILI